MTKIAEPADTGRTYAGESAGDRLARQRQQFMDAGLELFGTVGYRATTVRSLCKQAGLTDRYFYKNFTDTEDLLEAIYRSCMEDLQRKLLQAISAGPPGKDARAIVNAGLEAFFTVVEDARVARLCWIEILGVSPRIDQMYKASIRNFAALLLAVARSLFPHWRTEDEEGQILAIAVIGAVSQTATHWLLSDYRASRQTMVAATSRLFVGLATAIECERAARP